LARSDHAAAFSPALSLGRLLAKTVKRSIKSFGKVATTFEFWVINANAAVSAHSEHDQGTNPRVLEYYVNHSFPQHARKVANRIVFMDA
jgi:hypothetical protein